MDHVITVESPGSDSMNILWGISSHVLASESTDMNPIKRVVFLAKPNLFPIYHLARFQNDVKKNTTGHKDFEFELNLLEKREMSCCSVSEKPYPPRQGRIALDGKNRFLSVFWPKTTRKATVKTPMICFITYRFLFLQIRVRTPNNEETELDFVQINRRAGAWAIASHVRVQCVGDVRSTSWSWVVIPNTYFDHDRCLFNVPYSQFFAVLRIINVFYPLIRVLTTAPGKRFRP
ncbi:hypothetical protein TNCV_3362271 [Trichonephila clavipes]|nr:hypothetical protein TNCV_3362271 [Trichonephila clavipes]